MCKGIIKGGKWTMPVWLVDEPVLCRFFMFFICGLPHLQDDYLIVSRKSRSWSGSTSPI